MHKNAGGMVYPLWNYGTSRNWNWADIPSTGLWIRFSLLPIDGATGGDRYGQIAFATFLVDDVCGLLNLASFGQTLQQSPYTSL